MSCMVMASTCDRDDLRRAAKTNGQPTNDRVATGRGPWVYLLRGRCSRSSTSSSCGGDAMRDAGPAGQGVPLPASPGEGTASHERRGEPIFVTGPPCGASPDTDLAPRVGLTRQEAFRPARPDVVVRWGGNTCRSVVPTSTTPDGDKESQRLYYYIDCPFRRLEVNMLVRTFRGKGVWLRRASFLDPSYGRVDTNCICIPPCQSILDPEGAPYRWQAMSYGAWKCFV